jgi:hypothetical protein
MIAMLLLSYIVDSYLCTIVGGVYRIGLPRWNLGVWTVVHPQLSHKVFPVVGAESHHFISGWLRFRLLSLSCQVTILQG